MNVIDLRVKGLKEPFGIDTNDVTFSWIMKSNKRNVIQSSYRIQVISLGQQCWDSGIVSSDKSVNVPYGGDVLEPGKDYQWTVIVTDNHGDTAVGEGQFYTAISKEQFVAKWIETDLPVIEREPYSNVMEVLSGAVTVKSPDEKLTPSTFFRREFIAKKEIRKAIIYAAAHGVYQLELNGNKVGDRFLAPEFTSYSSILLYQSYDVTSFLQEGSNAIGGIVADGWWGGRIHLVGTSCTYGNKHALLCQLEIEYEDGTKEIIASGDEFKCCTGPFVYSDIFIGEKYDANLEMPGWSRPGFDDSGWRPVIPADKWGYAQLCPQEMPPVRIVQEFKPKDIFTAPNGDTIIDAGQVIAGFIRLTVHCPKGTVITLEHSEVLDQDGNFLNNITGLNKQQMDTFICSGEGDEVYQPTFSFHGFRYVRVRGLAEIPKLNSVVICVLSTDNIKTGEFWCSNRELNQLQSNIFWSQRGNMISLPTDCPQRERSGYTGDLLVYIATAAFNQDVRAFVYKWLKDAMAEQEEDGTVHVIAPERKASSPSPQELTQEGIAGWSDAIVVVPETLYQVYGDKDILEKCYPAMVKWVAQQKHRAATRNNPEIEKDPRFLTDEKFRNYTHYLWNDGFQFGDWLTPSIPLDQSLFAIPGVQLYSGDVMAAAYYANSVATMERVAKALGKTEDAKKYADDFEKIKEAFDYCYIDADGNVKGGLQGTQVIALKYNLVSLAKKEKVVNRLVEMIEKNGNRLDVGFLSVDHLMDALWENGHQEDAYRLLYQNRCPSWLYEVENGATTMWEAWDAVMEDGTITAVSFNHYAFGSIGRFLYERIGGIQKETAGYKKFIIKPQPDESLTCATTTFDSVYGRIKSEWRKNCGKFEMNVSIPCNTVAIVILPDGTQHSVGSGEYSYSCNLVK